MPLTAIKGPYIPRADGALREWLDNFAAVIACEPWAVGLTPADAQALLALAKRYAAAYVRATSPGTRGLVTVAEKNAVRRQVWDVVRPLSMRIKHNRGVDPSRKVELGIYPPDQGQSPIPKPRTAPQLEVIEVGRGYHRLRFRNPASPTRFAKPYGVVSMQLLMAVQKKPARSHREAQRLHNATRHVFVVKFSDDEIRKTATYFARWVTRRGKTGPWSRALPMTIV